jgi:hypothetical protein
MVSGFFPMTKARLVNRHIAPQALRSSRKLRMRMLRNKSGRLPSLVIEKFAKTSGERIMKKRHLIIFPILLISTSVYAQDGAFASHQSSSYDRDFSAASSTGPEAHALIVHSANDCAPNRAAPVWGANSALLGYSCVTPSPSGSYRRALD